MNNATDYKSALAQAIEAQPRAVHCFRIDGFLKAGGKMVPAVAILRSTKSEDDAAIVAAHKYVADLAKQAGDGAATAKSDGDLLDDAKTLEIIYRLCREVDPASIASAPENPQAWRPNYINGDKRKSWGAFPGPGWMRDNLSSDQLAMLLNLIHEVRRKEAPDPGDISDEAVEAVIKLCQEHASNDIPEAALSPFTRIKLTHLVVLLSVKLTQARLSVDTLLAQVEALEKAAAATAEASEPEQEQ